MFGQSMWWGLQLSYMLQLCIVTLCLHWEFKGVWEWCGSARSFRTLPAHSPRQTCRKVSWTEGSAETASPLVELAVSALLEGDSSSYEAAITEVSC